MSWFSYEQGRQDGIREAESRIGLQGTGGSALGLVILVIIGIFVGFGCIRWVWQEAFHVDLLDVILPTHHKAPVQHGALAPAFRPDYQLTQDVTFQIYQRNADHRLEQGKCTLHSGTKVQALKPAPRTPGLPSTTPNEFLEIRFPSGACGAQSANYGTTLGLSVLKPLAPN
jgi:hypothetical protein